MTTVGIAEIAFLTAVTEGGFVSEAEAEYNELLITVGIAEIAFLTAVTEGDNVSEDIPG